MVILAPCEDEALQVVVWNAMHAKPHLQRHIRVICMDLRLVLDMQYFGAYAV